LQACVAWSVATADVLSAFAISRCKQRVVFAVFKAFVWRWRLQVLLSLVAFLVHFSPVDGELWNEEDDKSALHCNFIFFTSLYVKLSFHCTANCFP
jgi:hypothetical protein